jgi:hypothetical protein
MQAIVIAKGNKGMCHDPVSLLLLVAIHFAKSALYKLPKQYEKS